MSAPSAPERESWMDIAKGIAIVLVAFHHSLQFLVAYEWSGERLVMVNRVFETLRMPLFFTVSGMLAANSIRTLDIGSLFRRKLLLLIWLYFFWCCVRSLWFGVVHWPFGNLDPLHTLLMSPLVPWSGLWYLYALVLYMVFAWLMRSLPVAVQLGFAALLSLGFSSGVLQISDSYVWRSIGTYFVFFLLGAVCRELIDAYVRRQTTILVVGLTTSFCVLGFSLNYLPGPPRIILRFLVSFLAVAAGVSLAVYFSRFILTSGWLGELGKRTLPIYVAHVLVLSVLVPVVPSGVIPITLAAAGLALVSIAVSLGGYAVLARVDGIYTLPAAVGRRFGASRAFAK